MVEPTMNLSGQHNLFNAMTARSVTIIGAGAVGGYVAVTLAKMGVTKLTVIDDDYVESHNIPMSVYRPCDLGRPKVEALRDIVLEASGVVIDARRQFYENEPLRDAVVCCVDTMEARQAVWRNVKMQPRVDILIDTRTAEELVWVFAIAPCDPDDIAYYEHHLAYTTKETAHPMCGRHGIVYASMSAASAVAADLVYWWQHGKKKRHHKALTGVMEMID
ncbi:MAG: ThiF family adenylyltransferase [bacterium]|nr:ThiF family adenylyltransferase [bacterium]